VLGAPPAIEGLSFWADSAFTAAAGIPTVLFGPVGAGAHADDEWVSAASVIACAEVLTATARAFCR
jgi:acetylornithine deacetylase